jgi:CBS domain-containing protein
MALRVHEIMNHELFAVGPDESAPAVRRYLVLLGITAAPVLDREHRPVGFVSLRDLANAAAGERVRNRMSTPADTVDDHATLDEAARVFADTNRHHLACIDHSGRAVGFVSAVDLLRALVGLPAKHPSTFPHYDASTGLTWTDAQPLTAAGVLEGAPDAPGLYVLVTSRAMEPEVVVWSEATVNVRSRLLDLTTSPRLAPPHLAHALVREELWFRVAQAPSTRALSQAADKLRHRTDSEISSGD